ncbi:hypothetical protein ACFTXJ_00020 [Streptomyces zhihengii]|uniref:hypothetical protein n=1 Tax=Streptomyces zhihengii TaxID=1818004 RepID=UPI00363CEA38
MTSVNVAVSSQLVAGRLIHVRVIPYRDSAYSLVDRSHIDDALWTPGRATPARRRLAS